MNLEDNQSNELSKETHQSYIQARTQQGMTYLADYDDWLAKHHELTELTLKNQDDTWEDSEHNPANYPDFDSLDDTTKAKRIAQGEQDYWQDSEALETKISNLEHLLINPNEQHRR